MLKEIIFQVLFWGIVIFTILIAINLHGIETIAMLIATTLPLFVIFGGSC